MTIEGETSVELTTGGLSPGLVRICSIVVLGSLMSSLDTTMVNVAVATLHRDLHSSIDQIQWVITAYTLALAAVVPISGWAADRFRPERVYVLALAVFTAGSLLCGLATNPTELILFRVVQGLGGGMMQPLGQLIIASAAGPKQMGRVMSIAFTPTLLGPILGPTLGGLILEGSTWNWIFFVNIPIGLAVVLAATRILPRSEPGPLRRLDVRGLVLITTGMPLLIYGLSQVGTSSGFGSPRVLVPCGSAMVLLVLFTVHALHARSPLLNLRLYRKPTFSTSAATIFLLDVAVFGGMILLPLYWQEIRHESVVHTGLLIGPQGVGFALAMPVAGKVMQRWGCAPPIVFGLSIAVAATIPFALADAGTSLLHLGAASFARGVGMGFCMVPAMTAAYSALDRSELAEATPQMSIVGRVGASLGTALLAVVLQRGLAGARAPMAVASAYSTAFWVAVALAAAAFIPAVILWRVERSVRNELRTAEAFASGADV